MNGTAQYHCEEINTSIKPNEILLVSSLIFAKKMQEWILFKSLFSWYLQVSVPSQFGWQFINSLILRWLSSYDLGIVAKGEENIDHHCYLKKLTSINH